MDGRTELITAVRTHLAGSLIALDFDGTLAPLVDDPASSRLAEGASTVIGALAAAGARIAVITGRDAHTVLSLSGLAGVPGLSVDGLYGAERWSDGELTTLPDQPALARARAELPDLVASHPVAEGVWIEDKRLSLVLHARTARDPAGALARLSQPVLTLAARLGLELHLGHHVIELRLSGYDKGRVLRRLVDEVRPAALLYAGDDLGDVPAFEAVSELRGDGRAAWAVAVGDPPVPEVAERADLSVNGPSDLVELLRAVSAGQEIRGGD